MRKETLQKLKNLTLKGNVAAKIEENPSDIEAVVVYQYNGRQRAIVVTKDKSTVYEYSMGYRDEEMHRVIKNKFSILTPWGKRIYFCAWDYDDLAEQVASYIERHTRHYFNDIVYDPVFGDMRTVKRPLPMAKGIKHEWPKYRGYTSSEIVEHAIAGARRVTKGRKVADSIQVPNPVDDKGNSKFWLPADDCEIKVVYRRKNVSIKIKRDKFRVDDLVENNHYFIYSRRINITINTNKE